MSKQVHFIFRANSQQNLSHDTSGVEQVYTILFNLQKPNMPHDQELCNSGKEKLPF